MGFRDGGEAARARADALAQELAERDAELETLRAKLAEKGDELRDLKQGIAPILDADRELAALKARGARQATEKARSKAEAKAQQTNAESAKHARERERRRLASVSVWGNIPVLALAPFAGLPVFLGMVHLSVTYGRAFMFVVPAGLALLLFAIKLAGRSWARGQWDREQAWASSHPYALVGYPELLEHEPASPSSRTFQFPSERHQLLQLEIALRDECLEGDLERIMKGFDIELRTSDPFEQSAIARAERAVREAEQRAYGTRGEDQDQGSKRQKPSKERSRSVFYRPSPIRTIRSRGGSSIVVDHNREIRGWVRRLQREVLAPLHARYGIVSVCLRLR